MAVRIIEGDCLAVLPTLEAGSFDAIVTDPPYAQTNESYDTDIACRPDVWRECCRVAADNAALIAFAGSPTYHRVATAIEAGGWKVRQMWGWVYRDGLITSAYPREGFDRLAPAFDPIVFATKGKVLLNADREGGAEWHRERNTPRAAALTLSARSSPVRATEAVGHFPRALVSDGAEPFTYFALPRAGRYRDSDHPNEKPVELMRWLVAKLPGRHILDPFTGSGTTGVAAEQLGRDFVGIEVDPVYAAVARQRIATVFGPLFAEASA